MPKMGQGKHATILTTGGATVMAKEEACQVSMPSENVPYFSPMLRPKYSNRAWVAEIVIGTIIVLIGLMFIIIQLARNKGQGSVSIGLGVIAFGGLFIPLGYCWYKSLKEKEELQSDILSVFGSHPSLPTQSTSISGTISTV